MTRMVCYTIGHSTRRLEDFKDIIKQYGIEYLIDIRVNPNLSNKYNKVYNKELLEKSIEKLGVNYIYMGKELRCLKYNKEIKVPNLDVAMECSLLKKGIRKIVEKVKNGSKVLLMCSERNPFNCYRSILIGYILKNNGIKVKHIIDKGNIKTQDRIEEEIFVTYEPALKEQVIKLTLQEVMENDNYDKISEKYIKGMVIEKGYRNKFEEITNNKVQ